MDFSIKLGKNSSCLQQWYIITRHKIVAQSSNKKLLQNFILKKTASEKFNFISIYVKYVCHVKHVYENSYVMEEMISLLLA